jgi:uncharacterized protein (TIGR02145 family)
MKRSTPNKYPLFWIVGMSIVLFSSCIYKDIDGNICPTVDIGSQKWMSTNLKVTHYRNGDPIPRVTDSATWANLTTGAYCEYDNDTNIGNQYGLLYNWYAVNDSRGLAPEGWRIPTKDDFIELKNFLEGGSGSKLKARTYSEPGWDGSNTTFFTALPAGQRGFSTSADCSYIGYWTGYWTITVDDSDPLKAITADLFSINTELMVGGNPKKYHGYSVRCILE